MSPGERLSKACWCGASGKADAWLRSLDVATMDSSSAAMHALGLLLCGGRIRFLEIVRGSGPRLTLPTAVKMIEARRSALLRVMIGVAKAPEVRTTAYAGDELAVLLGTLGVSYARSRDLTAVAMIVRAAGKLEQRHGTLDEACEFLLDQQAGNGAFGLLSGLAARPDDARAATNAQLRATVDVLSALDAYWGALRDQQASCGS